MPLAVDRGSNRHFSIADLMILVASIAAALAFVEREGNNYLRVFLRRPLLVRFQELFPVYASVWSRIAFGLVTAHLLIECRRRGFRGGTWVLSPGPVASLAVFCVVLAHVIFDGLWGDFSPKRGYWSIYQIGKPTSGPSAWP